MSYAIAETSQFAAQPYELYKFARGATTWAKTNHEIAISYLGDNYTPTVIGRSNLMQNNEDASSQVEITLPRDDDFVLQFIAATAPAPVSLTIFRNHTGEVSGETKTIFIGQVSSIEYYSNEVKILVTSLEAAFTRPLGRFAIGVNCNNMLYDTHCGVNQASFSFTASVSALSTSGLDLTVSGVANLGSADTYYANGFIIYAGQYRFINRQATAVMSLLVPFNPAPAIGATITIVAGCDRTAAVCNSRFANVRRFGGFPNMPQRSPWERLV